MKNKVEKKPLIAYALKEKSLLSISLLLTIFVIILQLIKPQITRIFLDNAMTGNVGSKLILIALSFIGVSVLTQIIYVVTSYFSQKFAWKIIKKIRISLFEHCLNLDIKYHKEHNEGELQERIDGDVSQIFVLYSQIIFSLFSSSLLLLGTLVILFTEHYFMGIAMLFYAVFAIVILWKVKSSNSSKWLKFSEANAEYYSHINEKFDGAKVIVTNNSQNFIIAKYTKLIVKIYPIVKAATMTWAKIWGASISIFTLGTVLSLSIGIFLWSKGTISIATIYLFYNYTEILRRPIEQLRVQLQSLQLAEASYTRINDLFNEEYTDITEGKTLKLMNSPALKVEDLSFSYDGNNNVLSNISFELNAGESVGIIGRTGSGKTTLVNLITRLYNVEVGNILIDGNDMNSFRIEDIYENVCYVAQDVEIFDNTLRENIRLFDLDIEDDEIINTIKKLGFIDWLHNYKNGLNTVIKKTDLAMSSGEKQILTFIRVFIKDHKMIIFDEATANIDQVTSNMIDKSLEKIIMNKTSLIVAHKLSTLNKVDNILILNKGKIEEYGERIKLENDPNSKYFKLLANGIMEVLV